jgi:hypothetical protein
MKTIKSHLPRAASPRRWALTFAAAALAALGAATPALAEEHHPTGEFERFSDCPLATSALNDCVLSKTTGGEFKIGDRTVPLSVPTTLQGGFIENEVTEKLEFVGAEDGNTLSKTPQPVPGGLLGVVAPEVLPKFLRNLLNKLISEGLGEVTATAELALPASDIGLNTEHLLFEKGTALMLPLKIKLSNVFLGESCYIGSSADPVTIELTTGKSGSLTGSGGVLTHNPAFTLLTLTGTKLVRETFNAPKAEGCGGLLSLLIDPAVNLELSLPAEVGNKAVLEGTLYTGNANAVRASE